MDLGPEILPDGQTGSSLVLCLQGYKMQPLLQLQADISGDDYMHNLTTWPLVPSECHHINNVFMLAFLFILFFF